MKLGNIEVMEDDDKVLLQIEFEDVNEAIDYCIDHEIKIAPQFIDKVYG